MSTPLAFNSLGRAPTLRLGCTAGILSGDQFLSSPFLLCEDEEFSPSIRHFQGSTASQLAGVLETAHMIFAHFFDINLPKHISAFNFDEAADSITGPNTSSILLQTCALATRIMHRTFSKALNDFDDAENRLDLLKIYANTRFMRLEAWEGLPYIYVWV
jgi:hypothetical protein